MKKVLKILGIIAFIAVIGFSLVTCGGDDGGKGGGGGGNGGTGGGGKGSGRVPVKFRFSDTNLQSQKKNVSIASRSVNVIKPRASVGVPASEMLDTLYNDKLGSKVESITPTKLELVLYSLFIESEETDVNNSIISLIREGEGKLVDFAQPLTFVTQEVLPGTYRLVYFRYILNGLYVDENTSLWCLISFPWPQDINFENHYYHNPSLHEKKPNDNNGNIELLLQYICPSAITSTAWSSTLGFTSPPFPVNENGDSMLDIDTIYMGGSSYKVVGIDIINRANLNFKDIDDKLPDFQLENIGGSIIVPFNDGDGFVIPDDADAVRFEVYCDLDGLVERYSGATDSHNDDIFILKNGFWNAFSIKCFVEHSEEPDTEE